MPGGSKKGGGLEVKKEYKGKGMPYVPFKMKGSPMQRNFGVGDSETPDAETPLNFNIGTALSNIGKNTNWGEVAKKALAAGMRTLPGGYDAYAKDDKDDKSETNTAIEDMMKNITDMDEEARELMLKQNPELAKLLEKQT